MSATMTASPTTESPTEATEHVRQVMRAAGHDPASVDQLAERTGLPASDIQASLLLLELDGKFERLTDGRYQKLSS